MSEFWVEGLGDLVILELAIMVDLNAGRASWLEVGGGVFIPLPVFCPLEKKGDRIFRYK